MRHSFALAFRGYLDQQIYIDKTFAEFDADGSGYVCPLVICCGFSVERAEFDAEAWGAQ